MHCLTQAGAWEMRIDYKFNSTTSYLHFTSFRIENSNTGYRMTVGGYRGIGGPRLLERYSGRPFSTADRDFDGSAGVNCAEQARSGFWLLLLWLVSEAYQMSNLEPPFLVFCIYSEQCWGNALLI